MTDWRETIVGKVNTGHRSLSTKPNTERGGKWGRSAFTVPLVRIDTYVHPDFLKGLNLLCKQRRLNRSALIRRALVVQMAKEFGVPARSLLDLCPATKPYGEQMVDWSGLPDNGLGVEEFCPHPGCDGAHLQANSK